MNKFIKTGILALGLIAGATDASAQFNLKKRPAASLRPHRQPL